VLNLATHKNILEDVALRLIYPTQKMLLKKHAQKVKTKLKNAL